MSPVTVLAVDDYEPFRRFICATLENPRFRVIGQASNGLEAVQKAEKLQPDLILLDIGLPELNGIEAAKRISTVAPRSKILFVSQETSFAVVEAALRLKVLGYVYKSHIQADLLPAIESVLAGRRFVSASLDMRQSAREANAQGPNRHEVLFYSRDATLIDGVARFIAPAIRSGNPAIVCATASHREALIRKLKQDGLDLERAIQEEKYISLDSTQVLASLMVNGSFDHVTMRNGVTDFIRSASKATNKKCPRVTLFGGCVNLLCMEGNTKAAIDVEKLWNDLLKTLDNVDLLCGYELSAFHDDERKGVYDSICKAHSAVHV